MLLLMVHLPCLRFEQAHCRGGTRRESLSHIFVAMKLQATNQRSTPDAAHIGVFHAEEEEEDEYLLSTFRETPKETCKRILA